MGEDKGEVTREAWAASKISWTKERIDAMALEPETARLFLAVVAGAEAGLRNGCARPFVIEAMLKAMEPFKNFRDEQHG